MAIVMTFGVQKIASQSPPVPAGKLVSGTVDDHPVLAISVHETGQSPYFLAFKGREGVPEIIGDNNLLNVVVIEGELIVEPLDGVVPFALPKAEGSSNGSLLVNDKGEIGFRAMIPDEPKPFVINISLETGLAWGGSPRALLRDFKLLLKVPGREKPFEIARFPAQTS